MIPTFHPPPPPPPPAPEPVVLPPLPPPPPSNGVNIFLYFFVQKNIKFDYASHRSFYYANSPAHTNFYPPPPPPPPLPASPPLLPPIPLPPQIPPPPAQLPPANHTIWSPLPSTSAETPIPTDWASEFNDFFPDINLAEFNLENLF